MNWTRIDAAFALVIGYLTGVTMAFIVPVFISSVSTGRNFFGSSLIDAVDLFFDGLYIIATWVIAAGPFFLVRACGGLKNAWLSIFGGIIIALLTFPLQTSALFAVLAIFDSAPTFLAMLIRGLTSVWPGLVIGGATGGLTFWSVEWLFKRLFRGARA